MPWVCRGHLLGEIASPGFAPTGRPFSVTGVDFYTLRADRVCEVRTITDVQSASEQVGLLPAPGSAAERAFAFLQRATVRVTSPWAPARGR